MLVDSAFDILDTYLPPANLTAASTSKVKEVSIDWPTWSPRRENDWALVTALSVASEETESTYNIVKGQDDPLDHTKLIGSLEALTLIGRAVKEAFDTCLADRVPEKGGKM